MPFLLSSRRRLGAWLYSGTTLLTFTCAPLRAQIAPPETPPPDAPSPASKKVIATAEAMLDLARQAATGNTAAVDQMELVRAQLFAGVDRERDREKVVENLVIMQTGFQELGRSVKGVDELDPAFHSLAYAMKIKALVEFAADALGIAAAQGNQPALEILLHPDNETLPTGTAVFALVKPALKGEPRAVDFLISILNDENASGLWFAAAQGLKTAARQGNAGAAQAIKKYQEWEKAAAQRPGEEIVVPAF